MHILLTDYFPLPFSYTVALVIVFAITYLVSSWSAIVGFYISMLILSTDPLTTASRTNCNQHCITLKTVFKAFSTNVY